MVCTLRRGVLGVVGLGVALIGLLDGDSFTGDTDGIRVGEDVTGLSDGDTDGTDGTRVGEDVNVSVLKDVGSLVELARLGATVNTDEDTVANSSA